MMPNRKLIALTSVALLLGGGVLVWSQEAKEEQEAGEQERQVQESEVPEAALSALKKLAGSNAFTAFAEEVEHGITYYEGSWKGANGNVDGLVTKAGDVVEIEESIAKGKAPAGVRKAAAKGAGEGTEMTFERKTVYLYEIHFTREGKKAEMVFSADGRPFVEPGQTTAAAREGDDDEREVKKGKGKKDRDEDEEDDDEADEKGAATKAW